MELFRGPREILKCRKCGKDHVVPSLAEKFKYWTCMTCKKINVRAS